MSYYRRFTGRSPQAVFLTVFSAVLGSFFIAIGDAIFLVAGIAILLVFANGVYSFIRNEEFILSIDDGVLTWNSARWPKSSGTVDLGKVKHIRIEEAANRLKFSFEDGRIQKIRMVGNGSTLRDHLTAEFPDIVIEFIEAPD